MANFEIAEATTGRNEGGYANNPADTGGETYAGIARNHWPKWEGWGYIDNIKMLYDKKPSTINAYAKINKSLTVLISKFYKQNFWDLLKLDQVNDQQLANSVYDFGVNSGTSRSAKFLQQAYNDYQFNKTSGKRLSVDGKIGSKTIEEINSGNSKLIYQNYNLLREKFYYSIAKGNQAQFLKSWLSRLKPYK